MNACKRAALYFQIWSTIDGVSSGWTLTGQPIPVRTSMMLHLAALITLLGSARVGLAWLGLCADVLYVLSHVPRFLASGQM